jgi:protein-disulfide isomerase
VSCADSRWAGTVVVALAAASGLALQAARASRSVSLEPAPVSALRLDPTTPLTAGPPDARVVVRIFGDYGCPACQMLDRAVADSLLTLAQGGHLRLVYLQRPLGASVAGESMALAVACAPNQHAWDVHRSIYRARERGRYRAWSTDPTAGLDLPASITGTARFRACLSSDSGRQEVRASIAAARSAGFHEVPIVLVNGVRVRYRTHGALLRHIVNSIEGT